MKHANWRGVACEREVASGRLAVLVLCAKLLVSRRSLVIDAPLRLVWSTMLCLLKERAVADTQSAYRFDVRVGLIDPLNEDRAANTWHRVTFDPPFDSGKKVVVLPMTQTYGGLENPGLRLRNVTNTSFEIRFDEIFDLHDGSHVDDTVGWVAYGF